MKKISKKEHRAIRSMEAKLETRETIVEDPPMLPSTELRLVFKEQNRLENPYLVVAGVGPFRGNPTDATLGYNPSAPPLNLSAVEAIHFHVASTESGPVPFDFCISNLQIY